MLITVIVLVVAAAAIDSGKGDGLRLAAGSSTTHAPGPSTTMASQATATQAAEPSTAPPPTAAIDQPASAAATEPTPAVATPAAPPAAGTGGGPTTAGPPPTPAAPASTVATVKGKTAAEWAQPAVPYHTQLEGLFEAISSAASKFDVATVQAKSGEMADVAHNLRLALESSGPPPSSIAVEGPAVMEAASELERNGRAVARCAGPNECTAALSNLNTTVSRYGKAVQALLSKI